MQGTYGKLGVLGKLKRDFKRNRAFYYLAIPMVLYYIIFHYVPMYGVTIAFKNYSVVKGVFGSEWAGLVHFKRFVNGFYFGRLMRNTFMISFYSMLFGFPAPIVFALLLNELRSDRYKRIVQSISYMPHFISIVVICGMLRVFSGSNGLFNIIGTFFTGNRGVNLLQNAAYFRSIYVGSGIWQGVGWGSIVYLSAISSIDPQLYESAVLDGANRLQQVLHITLPGIANTICVLFILNAGGLMSVGFEKVFLLYNQAIYETSDVISTYIYREGLINQNYSYSTAVGLFNSLINIALLLTANAISRRFSEASLF